MAKIKLYRNQMDCDGKGHVFFTALMGAAFFLRMAYHFGFTRPEEAGAWSLIVFLILPALLEIGYMVMVRGMKLDMLKVYGIMGAVCCLLLMLQAFTAGGVLRIILAIPAYLLCGAAVFGVCWGYLHKSLGITVLAVVAGLRFFVFDVMDYILPLRIIPFIREAAGICVLAAMICLLAGLEEKRRRRK
jgi:hypothetical protein